MVGVPERGYQPQIAPGAPAPLPGASPDAYGAGVGAQLERAGAGLEQAHLEAVRLETQRQKASEASDIGVRLARLSVDARTHIEDDLRPAAPPDGSGHAKKVSEYLDQQIGGILGGVRNKDLQEHFRAVAEDYRASVLGEETGWAHGQRVEFRVGNTHDLGRTLAGEEEVRPSENVGDRLNLIATTVDAQGLDPNLAHKLTFELQREVANAHLRGASHLNPAGSLALIESGVFNRYLTPEDIAQRREEAGTLIHRQEIAARAAERAAAALREQQTKVNIADAHDGVVVDPNLLLAQAAAAAADGHLELAREAEVARVKAIVATEHGGDDMEGLQNNRRAIEQKEGWRSDRSLVAAHEVLGTLIDKMGQRAETDQLGLFIEHGGTQPLPRFDLHDRAAMNAYFAAGDAAAQKYHRPVQYMMADIAAPLRADFQSGGAGDKAEVLATMSQYGAGRAKALVRQIVKPEDRGAYAQLVNLSTMRNVTVGHGLTREALSGWEQMAANPKIVADNESQPFHATISQTFGPALEMLDGTSRAAILRVAKGIYADRAIKSGKTAFDRETWLASYRAALGDAGDGTGGIGTTSGGKKFVLPSGATQDDWERVIARADGPAIEAAAFGGRDAPVWDSRQMSYREFKALTPVWLSDGLYMFRSDSGFARSKAHPDRNFILDVRALGRLTRGRRPPPGPPPGPVPTTTARSPYEVLSATHNDVRGPRSPYEIMPSGGQ
jgi:hypothetical protein